MRSAGIVGIAIIGDAVRVAISIVVSIHGERLSDVAPSIRTLDRVGKVDIGRPCVHWLSCKGNNKSL